MVQRVKGMLWVAQAVLIGGCAGSQVEQSIQPGTEFAHYDSFSIESHPDFDRTTSKKADGDEVIVNDAIERALRQNLLDRGLKETREKPDLIVKYEARARVTQDVQAPLVTPPAYYGSYLGDGLYPRAPDKYWLDELKLDVVDTSTNEVVFRARSEPGNKPFHKNETISETVEDALSEFPEGR
jgi:hypothetical protein